MSEFSSVQFSFVIIRVAVFNFAFNYLIENALCEMKTSSFENKSNSSGDICIFRLSAYSICSCCIRTDDDRSVVGQLATSAPHVQVRFLKFYTESGLH